MGIPALVIHELSHIVSILILGVKGDGVEIKGNLNGFEVIINYETKYGWKKNIVSMAPIGGFILWCIGIYFTSGLLFLGLCVYTLMYIRVYFPSKVDIDTYHMKHEVIDDNYEVPDLI